MIVTYLSMLYFYCIFINYNGGQNEKTTHHTFND